MEYTVRPYKKGEEEYAADIQRRIYSTEYRWGSAFLDYAVKIALDFPSRQRGEREELWVADTGDKLAGCVMLCEADEPDTAQLRLFSVESDCRRFGIGRALTEALMERVRAVGYKKLILWTASPLTDAIRHYEKLGFSIVEERENHTWSLDGESLNEIKMELLL